MRLKMIFLKSKDKYEQAWIVEQKNSFKKRKQMPEGDTESIGTIPGEVIFIGHKDLTESIESETIFTAHEGIDKKFLMHRLKIVSVESEEVSDDEIENIWQEEDEPISKEQLKKNLKKFKYEYGNV